MLKYIEVVSSLTISANTTFNVYGTIYVSGTLSFRFSGNYTLTFQDLTNSYSGLYILDPFNNSFSLVGVGGVRTVGIVLNNDITIKTDHITVSSANVTVQSSGNDGGYKLNYDILKLLPGSSLAGKVFQSNIYALPNHLHAGVYEPVFTKNTAFNKNFGTTAGTVAEGNHTHTSLYVPDTRAIVSVPENLQTRTLQLDFKYNTSVGNPPTTASPTFSHIISFAGWNVAEPSGGWPSQLSIGDGIAVRQAINATTWGTWRNVYHSGNFNPANYLPLTGGTLTGSLILSQPSKINFANGQFIKDNDYAGLLISSNYAINLNSATLTANGNNIWHSGNFNPTSYVTLDTPQTITAAKAFTGKAAFSKQSSQTLPIEQPLYVNGTGGASFGESAAIGFHNPNINYASLVYDGVFRFMNPDMTGYVDIIGKSLLSTGNIETYSGNFFATANGNTLRLGAQNSSWIHIDSNNSPFHFNRNVHVQGEIYAGAGYNQRVFHPQNMGHNSGLDADKLDTLQATQFVQRKHYSDTAIKTGWYKIKILPQTYWMLSFTIRLYQGYGSYDINISGYNYGDNYWYSPQARLITASVSESNITVHFGYDSVFNLWVAVPARAYTGLDIFDVVNGYHQVDDWAEQFEVIYQSSLTGTIQSTQIPHRPVLVNETIANATNAVFASALATPRTIWGQAFDGTANVAGDLSGVGSISATGDINTSGNVGIGTINPAAKLEVMKDATHHIQIGGPLNVGNNEYAVSMDWNSDKFGIQSYHHNYGYAELLLNPSGGNIGINTSTPTQKLSVGNGNMVFTNTSADGIVNTEIASITSQARGYFNQGANMASIQFLTGNPWYYGEIAFLTNGVDGTDPAISATERMRISSTGNVGIGTSTPVGKLQITGGWLDVDRDNGGVRFTSGQATRSIIYSNSSNDIRFSSPSSPNLFTALDNGNVGIGTPYPGYKLDVAGTGRFAGTVAAPNFNGSLTGNSDTTTKLQTARTIWGQSFDGTGNVTGALSGATTISASSTITATGNILTSANLIANSGITIAQIDGTGIGLSLYSSVGLDNSTNPTYGIMFALTANKGTHGAVTGD